MSLNNRQLLIGSVASGALLIFGYTRIISRLDKMSKALQRRDHLDLISPSDSSHPTLDFSALDSLMHLHSSVCNDRELNDVIERIVEVTYKLLKAERISMMILSRDKKKMTVVESKDMVGKELSVDNGIAAYVAKSGHIVNIKDAYQDPRFNPQCDNESDFKTKNILCAPIMVNHDIVGVITAINKLDDNPNSQFTKNDEFIIEYVATNAGIAIKKAQLYNQAIRQQRNSEAVLSIVRARTSDESVEKILSTTIDATYSLLMPELVSVYLCDHVMKEAWVCVSKDGLQGLTVPFGQGVAGTVAETGRAIRVDNAYSDDRFLRDVDNQTGFITKSILCVAVPGFANENKPIAVIQLINKMNGRGFDEDDEEALTMFCLEVSTALRRKVLELNLLRFSTYARSKPEMVAAIKLEESLLKEYGSISQRFKYSSVIRTKLTENKNTSPKELERNNKLIYTIPESAIESVQRHLESWDLNPFETRDSDLMIYVEHILLYYNLIETFKIDLIILRTFVSNAYYLYRSSNPFHNFKHGWSVMHMTFLILRSGADQYLTEFDILGTIIAALCHDLDHPGNNNAFEVAIRSELAITHSDDSVLERHHASMVHRLLNQSENNIFNEMSLQDQAEMRVLITDAIMSTDMTAHFFHVQELEDRAKSSPHFDITKQSSRRKLIGHIVHTADLSGQVLKQEIALQWGECCVREFQNQCQKEKELNIPVTPFMSGLENELQMYRLQLGFVNNIVIPLWNAMAECFPKLNHRCVQGIKNSAYYSSQIDRLTKVSETNKEN